MRLYIFLYFVGFNNFKVYSLRPANNVRLAFKFCPTNIVRLNCSKVHLTKAISNTKKELYWEGYEASQIFK